MIKFGLQHPCFTYDGDDGEIFETLKKRVQYAEENGFDSFWVMDHFFQIPVVGKLNEPMLEGWATISALTQVSKKIKLGTLVTGNIYRAPALLAKMAATLDLISKGRLFMGIGGGWFETEAVAYGIPFYTVQERLKRLDEALQIIRGMWMADVFSFDGRYYKIKDALCVPKPVQKPHPPILIGGGGEKVTLNLVAKHGDACNLFGEPQTISMKLEKLRRHCERVGRNYEDILKTWLGHLIVGTDPYEVSLMVKKSTYAAASTISGAVDEVVTKIQEVVDTGIHYLIFNLDFPNEEKALKLLAEKVMPQF